MGEPPERTALYRFYDADGQLLYVGISNNPARRWRSHRRDHRKTWWPQIAEKTVEWFDTRSEAASAETRAIGQEDPLHNIKLTPKDPYRPQGDLFGQASFELAQIHFGYEPFTAADLFAVGSRSKAGVEQHIRALRKRGQLAPVGRRSNAPRTGKRHVLYVISGSPLADAGEPILQKSDGASGERVPTLAFVSLERARERFGVTPFAASDLIAVSDYAGPTVRRHMAILERHGFLAAAGRRARTGLQGFDPKLFQVVDSAGTARVADFSGSLATQAAER